jgi:lipopolysaccharide export system ATP-binding protein
MKSAVKLVAQNLKKRYGRRWVVNGANLEVGKGEIVGLLGPNGAGKTTTFYMMVGLTRPNVGRVAIDGADITKVPLHQRARLGISYLAQEPSVFRRLSVGDNILACLELQPLSRAERLHRRDELLEELHVAHLRDSPAYVLSGGERRRVEIARALATRPLFLLLDEPFTGIDPIAVDDIHQIITHLRSREIGILLTDHSVRETLSITDRSYIMFEGSILTSGPSAELPRDPVARKFYLGERFEM